MPNNSPKVPPKSPGLAIQTTATRKASLAAKSPRLLLNVSNNSPTPRQRRKSAATNTNASSPSWLAPQFGAPTSKSSKKSKKKKKKSCYSMCCCTMFVALVAFLFVTILQESFDPDGELAVRFMETEVLQDLAGPNIELPGARLAKQGLTAHFPVVFIPGIVSTGLEVWQGHPCAQRHFRQRFWGTGLMLRKILLAKQCWLQHIMLTPEWTDPPGIKLRPAQGLVAADYLVADYWVWARVIENLAYLGYDESNMYMASYDWRLPFRVLETRDRYFTRLKANIELLRITNNHTRVVLVAHSMGSNVVIYFLRWVENNFGSLWVEKNIESFINIGGPLLGVSKTISSLLSGEMRDTAELNPTLQFIKENFLSKEDLMHIFRSFGSLPSMMPKGIWPGPILKIREDHIALLKERALENSKSKPTSEESSEAEKSPENAAENATESGTDDITENTALNNSIDPTTESASNNTTPSTETTPNETVKQAEPKDHPAPAKEFANNTNKKSPESPPSKSDEFTPPTTDSSSAKSKPKPKSKSKNPSADEYEAETETSKKDSDSNDEVPTETVGDENQPDSVPEDTATPSGKSPQDIEPDVTLPPYVNFTVAQALELLRQISPGYMDLMEQYYDLGFNGSRINLHDERQWVNPLLTPLPQASLRVYCMYGVGKPTEYSVNEDDVFHGVVVGDGDGTVPLLSLGYLCAKGWHTKELNPSSVPVVTREYQHSVLSLLEGARAGFDGLRGGYGTADHVDIMGNHHMLEDITKILSNQLVDEVQNQFYSNIEAMSQEVRFESGNTVE